MSAASGGEPCFVVSKFAHGLSACPRAPGATALVGRALLPAAAPRVSSCPWHRAASERGGPVGEAPGSARRGHSGGVRRTRSKRAGGGAVAAAGAGVGGQAKGRTPVPAAPPAAAPPPSAGAQRATAASARLTTTPPPSSRRPRRLSLGAAGLGRRLAEAQRGMPLAPATTWAERVRRPWRRRRTRPIA